MEKEIKNKSFPFNCLIILGKSYKSLSFSKAFYFTYHFLQLQRTKTNKTLTAQPCFGSTLTGNFEINSGSINCRLHKGKTI